MLKYAQWVRLAKLLECVYGIVLAGVVNGENFVSESMRFRDVAEGFNEPIEVLRFVINGQKEVDFHARKLTEDRKNGEMVELRVRGARSQKPASTLDSFAAA